MHSLVQNPSGLIRWQSLTLPVSHTFLFSPAQDGTENLILDAGDQQTEELLKKSSRPLKATDFPSIRQSPAMETH